MQTLPEWLLPLIFYTIMLWLYRFSMGQNLLGKPKPTFSEEWQVRHGRTMRRAIIFIVAAYSALLLVQFRP
jgi:hypothetical protein